MGSVLDMEMRDLDREWAWWLTMRELAAVAGLALWVWRYGLPPNGPVVGQNPFPVILADYRAFLGWEAPDA